MAAPDLKKLAAAIGKGLAEDLGALVGAEVRLKNLKLDSVEPEFLRVSTARGQIIPKHERATSSFLDKTDCYGRPDHN